MPEKKMLGFGVERCVAQTYASFVYPAHIAICGEFGDGVENTLSADSTDTHIMRWIQGYIAGRRNAIKLVEEAAERAVHALKYEIEKAESAAKGS